MGTVKQEIADKTKLSKGQIMALTERVLGPHRGDPLPIRDKVDAVGQFLMAMQTAIGDHVGWEEGRRILLHIAPDEAVEVTLCRHALKYPASIRKGHPTKEVKMNDEAKNEVTEEERTATTAGDAGDAGGKAIGRRSKLSGKRLTYAAENNRKPGTKSHASIQLLIDNPGVTLEEFEQLGGRRQDILWDLKTIPGAVQVEDAA